MVKISTIYIIDDNLVFLNLFEKLLKLKGFQIIGTTNDGELAVKMFKSLNQLTDYYRLNLECRFTDHIKLKKKNKYLKKKIKII